MHQSNRVKNNHQEFACIAVIGLGYVGLPLAIEFGKKYEIIGFDINKSIDMLKYKPTTNVDVGIKKLIKWYKEFYKC